jgi:signal transduction histidine kinase
MGMSRIHSTTETDRSSRLQTTLGITFSALTVSISALLAFTLYLTFRAELRTGIREHLRDVVRLSALALDGDAHATLTSRAQEGSPTYLRIQRVLQEHRDHASNIRFAYTWRRSPAGRMVFVVDAETDPNQVSHLGDVYETDDRALTARLATLDHAAVDEHFTHDKWGTWLSGYAPFYRSDGTIEGILGMDIGASDVLARERQFLWMALAVFGAMVPLALLLGLSLGRQLAAPIVALTAGAERVARGDLSHRVSVRGSREIETLVRSFNRMTDILQKTIAHRDEEIHSREQAEQAIAALNVDLEATVEQLARANRDLRNLAFMASHDLKTPLRGIRVLTDWITVDYADCLDDKGREYLDLLTRRTTRMYNLIEAVNQYTSLQYNEGSEEARIDLNMLVPRIVKGLNPPENVEVEVKGDLPVVFGNRERLTHVFEHLLRNAITYMDKPVGRIVVDCVEDAAFWRFAVCDNGRGIDEKYHHKIFELFQTLSTKDQYETTGMGLSIVRKIVELSGGRIWVDSQPGRGATLFFTLPKATAPADAPATPRDTAPDVSRETSLCDSGASAVLDSKSAIETT